MGYSRGYNFRKKRGNFVGQNNPNWSGGRYIICPICGTKVWKIPKCFRRSKNLFCSTKCMHQWQHNTWKGDNETLLKIKASCVKTAVKVKEKQRIASKNLWFNDEYVAKQMKSRGSAPNKKEKSLEFFIKSLSLPYKFVGDGQFILGGKCPDYVNVNGEKKLIELYGDYWHQKDDPQVRIDYFEKYGFDTLVIWECELDNASSLKEKLLSFDARRLINEY